MGRLTLNMLLSFAQFEREVTAERIRDKIAASKKKGLWMGASVPIGYNPDGRTLLINEEEAETVRAIFRLYRERGTIREVKEECDALGLRTRLRTLSTGKQIGGTEFFRGHLQYILSNPVYAGKIRHHGEVHEGLHPPIIDPDEWDRVQACLQTAATKARRIGGRGRHAGKPLVSLLVGKVFDETGDRLTPTHSKTSAGTRLRYYVSNRLIKESGTKDITGWRLPAPELEALVERLVRRHLEAPDFVIRAVFGLSAEAILALRTRIDEITIGNSANVAPANAQLLELVHCVNIETGRIQIELSAQQLAKTFNISDDDFENDGLSFEAAFQHRKRGVETKLILSGEVAPRDETLFRNIAVAHKYLAAIKSGRTLSEISGAEGTSKQRIQHLVKLAFLTPEVVRRVHEGQQPVGLTCEWLLRNEIPFDWQEQRSLFATL